MTRPIAATLCAATFLAFMTLCLPTRVAAAGAESGGKVELKQGDGVVEVTIDGKPFTTYHFDVKDDPQFVRPYFFPVLAADGTPITSDQIEAGKTDPKADHPHHRSFWVAHGDVDGADHWSLSPKDKSKSPRQLHVAFDRLDGDTIVESLDWESKNQGPALLKEKRTYHFMAFPDGARGVDVTVALTPAGNKPVTLADTKEAGLCAIRLNKALADRGTLSNSEGAVGEKKIWGKPANWVDLSIHINGKPYGVAIFDSPTNAAHPTRWHARQYGLLAPNPWALSEYDKAPKGAGDQKLPPGKETTFKYRVVFHEGDAKTANIAEKYAEFAK